MKIVVQGLWHLGTVTAACCAQHNEVTGLDFDVATISNLCQGKAPLFEPGLDDLISAGLKRGSLRFSSDPAEACAGADVLWLCYDTPVNDEDESDIGFVLKNLLKSLPHLPHGALVLISSQLPVGTTATLEKEFPQLHFAVSPENLRLGKAIEAFTRAERVVVGQRDQAKQELLRRLFEPYTPQVIFMGTESAEMVKHALNSFLALSITFINEIARLCERTGADAREVAAGLKSDARIGPRAYLGPGGPFAGGTLARDVVTLTALAQHAKEQVPLISAIKSSNDEHRHWNFRRLQLALGNLRGKTIAVLGLTYKPGTDTLRRSTAVELCRELVKSGAQVRAVDPVIQELPGELSGVSLAKTVPEALSNAAAVVICTEWPEFRQVDWKDALAVMAGRLVLDANGFLGKELKDIPGVEHVTVGRKPKNPERPK
ncbi:MAG TPA: nucleotide sugar dehydrogenase [Verrucomicrobiae bacterium]|nr:nucleotide sugar dehydrogenase [Verrucomicrobiae bacterium]